MSVFQAPIFMTGVMEYTISEVLEGAGELARLLRNGEKVPKITPRIIRLVICNDDELNQVFKGVIFPGSGGGNYLSKKHLVQISGKVAPTSEDDSEVEEITRRKGGYTTSRAKSKNRRHWDDSEVSDDSESEVEDRRGVKDRKVVRKKAKNR